ncbi:MFS transporter [Clostridium sp. WLY-B-L2]|uniref:MFS transporter n=1 Tax=Clostridium aromativorans TaxID=2836848 RepID=A0ABS8N6J0_9CLOT|nr:MULTISPECIES: MFS transporter [Clostridium]KAA8676018.1 MFS transporter [Clostridium sp. HV4-5-A1G]MCC9295431.1 MFS transporter [Clostridium aromativorans]CAB1247018.1 Transporter major facilitator superfamily MFS_1 [Clostridiaceae bacterium BL-3]
MTKKNSKYLIFALLYIAYCILYVDRAAMNIALTSIGKDFGLNASQSGLVLSAFYISYAFIQVPGGWLSDKFGSKVVIIISILMWSVFTMFTGFSWSFTSLLIIRFMFGIGEGPYTAASLSETSEVFDYRDRSKATSSMLSSNYVGSAIAPIIVAPLIIALGWRATFHIIGILGIAFVAIYYLTVRPIRKSKVISDDKKINKKVDWKGILTSKMVWQFIIIALGISMVNKGLDSWMPTYLLKVRDINIKSISYLVPLPFIGAGIGAFSSGWIMDRFFKNKEKLIIALSSLLTMIFVFEMYNAESLASVIIFEVITYFFKSITFASTYALFSKIITQDNYGSSIGLLNFGSQMAGFISPLAMGFLVDMFNGSYNAAFLFLVFSVGVAFVVSLTLNSNEIRKKSKNAEKFEIETI